MTINLVDIIDYLHPAPSGIGIITTDTIWVVFDRELDETSLSAGNFFLAGPDFDTWSGPDLQIWEDAVNVGTEAEILQSPGFHGLVQGDISFKRVALNSFTVISGLDTTGSGFLYRTLATFTPRERLAPETEYTVYLSGDEDSTDTLTTGILSRTVFDIVASGTNTGTGIVAFTGGYDGLFATDTFRAIITTQGGYDVGQFTFTRDSDPVDTYGPFPIRRSGVFLGDGVWVYFSDNIYEVGDQYSVLVKAPAIFNGNLTWPFKTGTGSIQNIPVTTATSVIETAVMGTPLPLPTTFTVTSTTPVDGSTNLPHPPGDYTITIRFSSDIDPLTVASGISAFVTTEAVTGNTSDGIYPPDQFKGSCATDVVVNGKILSVIIASGELLDNNLVIVDLASSITSTAGIPLSAGYSFAFTTTYYPMYCSSRRLRLMAGNYLSGITDDALNLAIHLASLESDLLTWNKRNLGDQYYHFVRSQWSCCRAAQYLLINTVGGSGRLKAKRLGDLAVEYDTNKININVPLEYMQECLDKWAGALLAGGRQVQTPEMVVKGQFDIDRPKIGRGWLHTRDWLNTQTPAANMRIRPSISRRYRGAYGHRGWWEK